MDKKITYNIFNEKVRCPQDIEGEQLNLMKDILSNISNLYEMM